MIYMLCRNRVADFDSWYKIFSSPTSALKESGLQLVNLWRSVEDPNNVFFIFRVESIEKAKAFVSTPEAAETGKRSGVLDGEYHFLRDYEG